MKLQKLAHCALGSAIAAIVFSAHADQYLKLSTASQEAFFGPFVDDTDFKTAETALSIANTDIKCTKAGATSETNKNSGGATHMSNGRYYAVMDATDTNTLGTMRCSIKMSGALEVWENFHVLSASAYDDMFGSTVKVANVTQINGQTASASGTVTFPNATLASTTNITAGTITTVTNLTNLPAITAGWLTANGIASDAFTAAKFHADVTTEITSGLATATNVTNAQTAILKAIGQNTTIASRTDNDTFTLTAGSADDNAYNGWAVMIVDQSTAAQTMLGCVSDYTGSTKTVQLAADPGIFTSANGDFVYLLPAYCTTPVVVDQTVALNSGTSGSIGEAWSAAGAAGDPWTTSLPGSYTGSQAGKVLADILVDTGTTLDDLVDDLETRLTSTRAGYLDKLNITGNVANQGSVDAVDDYVDTEVAAIQTYLNNNLGTNGANATAADDAVMTRLGAPAGASVSADIAAVKSDSAAILVDTGTTLDGKIDTIDGNVDAILVDTGTTLQGELDGIQAVTDKLDDTLELDSTVYRFTQNALEQAPTGMGEGAQTIAEAVAANLFTFDTGETEADAVAGSVVYEIVQNVSGGGGSTPTAQEIREEIDSNSTQLAAIKAKTDNLPSDPADASVLAGLIDALPTAAEVRSEMDSNSADLNALMLARTQLFQGTADSGDTNTLVDAALTARFGSNDLLNGRYIVRADGQACFAEDYVASTGTVEFGACTFTGAWSTQTYDVYPAGTQE